MGLLLTGDWHLRTKAPANRLGNFYEDQMNKLEWILNTAEQNQCQYILQPGDLGHTPNWSNYLAQEVIHLLKSYGIKVLTIPGQHDMKYHALSSMERTSMSVLDAAGVIWVLNSVMSYSEDEDLEFAVYGVGFGGKIEEPEIPSIDCLNILVIHKMILRSHTDKIWRSQEEYAVPSGFLAKHKDYDLIVSGDNHTGFIVEHDERLIVNCGCLMRDVASEGMFEHKPFVVVYDTNDGSYEQIFVPCKPAEEILDRSKIEEVAERDEKLEAFVSGLTDDYSIELDFRQNLAKFLVVNKDTIDKGVKEILREVLDD